MQEQITALISKAAEVHDELDRERAAAQSGLDSLASSSAAMHSIAQQALPELPKARCPFCSAQVVCAVLAAGCLYCGGRSAYSTIELTVHPGVSDIKRMQAHLLSG